MHNLCLNTTFKISTVPFKRIQTNLYIFKISRIECTGHTVVVAMFAIPFKNVFSSEREYPGLSTELFGVTTYNILSARHSKTWKKYYMNNKFKGTCCVGRGAGGVLFYICKFCENARVTFTPQDLFMLEKSKKVCYGWYCIVIYSPATGWPGKWGCISSKLPQ